MENKPVKQRQEMIYSVPFFRSKLPDEFKAIADPRAALRAYAKDLYLQLKTKDQITGILLVVCSNMNFVKTTVEDLEKSYNNKQDYYEQLVLRGLGLALQQQNLNAYYKGVSLLKDLYGIQKNVVATIKNETETLPEEFFALKEEDLKN